MKAFFTAVAITYFFTSCQPASTKKQRLEQLAERYFAEGYYNGTILVADSTGILLEKAYGMADFANSIPLQPASTFYLASVSKQFTAMAIMLLYERAQLSFDDQLSSFFPNLPDWADSVTIRHLLTHTSGIPDYYELGLAKPGFTNKDVVALAGAIEKLNFPPGAKYEYSNTAYVLLSSIVQQVTQQGFNDFMQANIFGPSGMTSTVAYDESKPERKNRCKGFDAEGKEDDYLYFTTGGGGIYSNVQDLYKWHLALQGHKLVAQSTFAQGLKPMTLSDSTLSYYGFGWMLVKNVPDRVFHTGTLTSFRTYIERDLKTGSVVIMLNNVGKTKREELLEELNEILTRQL